MTMRIFILLFFVITGIGYSQFNEKPILNLQNFDKQKVHWGYYFGLNFYDFKFKYNKDQGAITDVQVARTSGFNVGLIGDLRLAEHFNLRLEPGLSFTRRDLLFNDPAIPPNEESRIREVKSTYIQVPLLVKYSAMRLGNWKPYVLAGISASLNLSSDEKNPEDNSNNVFRMKTYNYYYEVGLGIDFYLPYFKFSPSLRGVFGLGNELVPDDSESSPWTGNIDSLLSRGIFINLSFE